MRCDELNFKTITYGGESLLMARHTFTNGFTVSVIKELEDEDGEPKPFNAAIIKEDNVVITPVHCKCKNFIIGNDYTFDLVDKRQVTFLLKNVDTLYPGDDFTDVFINENGHMVIGKKHPTNNKEILKIIDKITPYKKVNNNE